MLTKRQYVIPAIALLVIASLIFLALRFVNRGNQDAAWEHIQATGTLRVGLDASYPPFEYVNEQSKIIGFDVDLADEIGRRMDVNMEYVNIAYDGLYDALLTRRVDVLISGLVATPEFAGRANFSIPYFNAGEYLVVRTGSSIFAMEDMEGRSLAVEYGAGGDVEARKWERRLSNLTVLRYPDSNAALQAVVDGGADAALVDGIAARLGVGQHPELALADNVVETLIAAGVHPESPTLAAQIDQRLADMIEDGTVSRLIDKWFGPQRDVEARD